MRPRNQHAGRQWPESTREKMSRAKRGKLLGENNPNWRGGYVDETARERRSYRAKVWRESVKERDGHKCIECGSTSRLHAHHVKRWRDYPELRFSLDNGVTLCSRCHEVAHGWKFPDWVHGEKTTSAELS